MAAFEQPSDASPPYSLRLGQEDALELVKEGASLLILDMIPNTIFGFDLHMLTVGPLFKGLKMIPPGPHFVYYSATTTRRKHEDGGHAEGEGDGGGESSVITGFFIHPGPREVLVRQWDAREELLVKIPDPEQEERYINAVRRFEFDRFLGSYDVHRYQAWKRLTSYISPQVIEQFEPVGGNISVVAEADFDERQSNTPAERRLHEYLRSGRERRRRLARHDDFHMEEACDAAPCETGGRQGSIHMTEAPGTAAQEASSGRCFYTKLPHHVQRAGALPAEVTMMNVDKSVVLQSVLQEKYAGSEDLLLGELQFAFIAFLMGQSLESFSQWKSIVCLLLSCDEAPLHTHTRLFVNFLGIVSSQLQMSLRSARQASDMPLLDATWFSEDNFLLLLLKEFYRSVTEAHPVDGDLLKETRRLKVILESSLGWRLDFKELDLKKGDFGSHDEYAPVLVLEDEL